jgi:hypothetical protein
VKGAAHQPAIGGVWARGCFCSFELPISKHHRLLLSRHLHLELILGANATPNLHFHLPSAGLIAGEGSFVGGVCERGGGGGGGGGRGGGGTVL